MTVWVIYFNPRDFPGHFVLRPQFVVRGSKDIVPSPLAWSSMTIDTLRQMLPPGLTRMDRNPADDKPIVETWI